MDSMGQSFSNIMGPIPYLPPTKWVPAKCLTSGFGAVRLIKVAGMNLAPGPVFGGPSSILHDEGASTERTGTLVFSMAAITSLKGSRTSPEKLKPEKCKYGTNDGPGTITKYCIHNMIRGFQRVLKVLSKWDIQILQLSS